MHHVEKNTATDMAMLAYNKLDHERALSSYIITQKRVRDLVASIDQNGEEKSQEKIKELQKAITTQLPAMGNRYIGYYLTDKNGTIIVGVSESLQPIRFSVGDGPYFKKVKGIGKTVISDNAISGLKAISEGEGDLTRRLKVNSQDEAGRLSTTFSQFTSRSVIS